MNNKLIRKNVQMSKELAEWLENKSKKFGMSQSSIIVMALADYIKQENAMSVMNNMGTLMEQYNQLQNNTKSKATR